MPRAGRHPRHRFGGAATGLCQGLADRALAPFLLAPFADWLLLADRLLLFAELVFAELLPFAELLFFAEPLFAVFFAGRFLLPEVLVAVAIRDLSTWLTRRNAG